MKPVMPVTAWGPLAATLDELSAWLIAEGYAPTMVPQVLGVTRGLSAWMDDHDICLADIDSDVLERFQSHYGPGVPGHVIVKMRIPVLRRFLIESGHLPDSVLPRKRPRPPDGKRKAQSGEVVERELAAWAQWQRETRGISEGCIRYRRMWATELLDSLPLTGSGIDWAACDGSTLNAYAARRSAGYSPASGTAIIDSIRSLMRWALATGRVDRDVTPAILARRTTRATLPKGLTADQVRSLLGACDSQTISGVRDAAVIQLLWRLGLRAGECAGLNLDDIDWAQGQLSVVGKGQRRLTVPMPRDVGESLVAWLRKRPAHAGDRAVFVRLRRPIRALSSAGISTIVKHRGHFAGLGVIHAHRLRHTAAMNVIAAGGSLIEAQELLGHQNTATTSVYARADLASLRELIVPFGQVPR